MPQKMHSIEKLPVFVANRVTEILELMTVQEWNQVPTADKPADPGTRGLSANSLFKSSWLKGLDFLKSFDWPFNPCIDVITNIKSRNFATKTEMIGKRTHETTTLSMHITTNASTFEWQKYSS